MNELRKTSEMIAEARATQGYTESELRWLLGQCADRLQLILDGAPPDGWFPLGSHLEFEGPLEFSDELGGDGLPRWERHP